LEAVLKSGRISAMVSAGAMIVGSLAGATGAGPAAAATYHPLCVNGPAGVGTQCIDSEFGIGQVPITLPYGTAHLTNWAYPTGSTPEPIQQADNVNYCLQLNAAAGEVIGAKCVGDDAEKWIDAYDAKAKRTLFESSWALDNHNTADCLAFSISPGVPTLYLEPCQKTADSSIYWDQQWGTS
jgi:hypothetical protein